MQLFNYKNIIYSMSKSVMLVIGWLTMLCTTLAMGQPMSCPYRENNQATRIGCVISFDAKCHHQSLRCQLRKLLDLRHLQFTNTVHSLDLSKNGIVTLEDGIFKNLSKLEVLLLPFNNIQHIHREAFDGLTNLRRLDLSFNSLQTWDTGNITKQLPFLAYLDVTANLRWSPGRHIANHPKIKIIKGVVSYAIPLIADCIFCMLTRRVNGGHQTLNETSIQTECIGMTFIFSNYFSSTWDLKSSMKCHIERGQFKRCGQLLHINSKSSHYSVHLTDVCWSSVTKWTSPNIPIGLVAMVTNAIVFVTVGVSKVLRNNVTMFFVAHMAIGDFLNGLYLVIVTATRSAMSSFQFFNIKQPYFCPILMFLYYTAQCLIHLISFLVTIERYVCVIYTMKPNVRVTLRIAKFLLLFVWLMIAVVFSVPLILRMRVSDSNADYSCLLVELEGIPNYTIVLGGFVIVPYVISYVLYAHIFYTVRRSSLDTGIQREGRLAKRIILITSTNLFFAVIPIVALSPYTGLIDVLSRDAAVLYTFYNTVTYISLGINSCINPCLYAFRNEKFQKEFKRLTVKRQRVENREK